MDYNGLKKELEDKKIPKDAYSFNGGLPNEAFCIGSISGGWEVYYSERGQKSGLKTFKSETDACDYMLEIVDKGTKHLINRGKL